MFPPLLNNPGETTQIKMQITVLSNWWNWLEKYNADFLFYLILVTHDRCNETKTQKLGNYKTHLLSHECNEPLDQTGAELENLGHSVQALLVSVHLLLQYHRDREWCVDDVDKTPFAQEAQTTPLFLKKDVWNRLKYKKRPTSKVPLQGPRRPISGIYKLQNKQRQRQAPKHLWRHHGRAA